MSLKPGRRPSLLDKIEAKAAADELSAKEKEEEKIKSSKKPSPKKLTS